MKAVQRLFLLAIAFVVMLGAALGTFLYVSLIPFFHEIGIAATVLLVIGLGCAALLIVNFTVTQISVMWSHRLSAKLNSRVIIHGDIMLVPQMDGSFYHASALHEAAKIPQIAAPAAPALVVESDNSVPDSTILTLHEKGLSLRDIEKVLSAQNVKYHRIQRVTSEAKKG